MHSLSNQVTTLLRLMFAKHLRFHKKLFDLNLFEIENMIMSVMSGYMPLTCLENLGSYIDMGVLE